MKVYTCTDMIDQQGWIPERQTYILYRQWTHDRKKKFLRVVSSVFQNRLYINTLMSRCRERGQGEGSGVWGGWPGSCNQIGLLRKVFGAQRQRVVKPPPAMPSRHSSHIICWCARDGHFQWWLPEGRGLMYATLAPPPSTDRSSFAQTRKKNASRGPRTRPHLPRASPTPCATGRLNGRTFRVFSYTRMRQYSLIGYIIGPLIMEVEWYWFFFMKMYL